MKVTTLSHWIWLSVAILLPFAWALQGEDTHIAGKDDIRSLQSRAPVLPDGWGSAGCFRDSAFLPTIYDYYTTSSRNTPESCIATCSSQGYRFAGLERGRQCWCGNALRRPVQVNSSQCNERCPGDRSQTCGATRRLQVYQFAPPPPIPEGWSPRGCFTDSIAYRALPSSFTSTASNTPATCLARCRSRGFAYAGLEYGVC